MYNYNPLHCLPSSAELPDSDDKPVDSELQILVPNLLLAILSTIWQNRDDWYFGINMGVYYEPSLDAIVPDGFLCLQQQQLQELLTRLQQQGIDPNTL